METVSGHIKVAVEDTKVLMHAYGRPVATLALPKGDDNRESLSVILPGGDRWTVHWTIPPAVTQLLEGGGWLPTTAVSPRKVPAWASVVHGDRGTVAEAEVGVSAITLAPVAIVVHSGESVHQVTAGPSWRSWSLATAGKTVATIDSDDDFVVHATRPLPMAVLTLAVTNGLAVASRVRPRSLTRGAMEDQAEAEFLNKYGRAADMALEAGHNVQYMSAWDQRANLYSWIECLRCGQVASTFLGVRGAFLGVRGASKTTIAEGKTFDKLLATILNSNCTGTRIQ